jgi:hypothetical protein
MLRANAMAVAPGIQSVQATFEIPKYFFEKDWLGWWTNAEIWPTRSNGTGGGVSPQRVSRCKFYGQRITRPSRPRLYL